MSSFAVLHTKITPQRNSNRILSRERVTQRLRESLQYRLTLLQAGAGYGKSTALASLAEEFPHLIWYQLGEEDSDPFVFIMHLCQATHRVLPDLDGLPIPLLESWDGSRGPLPSMDVVNQYLNALSTGLPGPTLLVLDDVQLVSDALEINNILDRVVGLAPADLHILMAGRPTLKLPNLFRWRAQGKVLTLDHSLLAFTPSEIAVLFAHQYGYELTEEECQRLHDITEGWAITLPLIWQSLRAGSVNSIEDALTRQSTSLDSLFDVLAKEVLGQQPQDIQDFMRISSILRSMTPEACDMLRDANDSAAMLAYLRRQELFVFELGDKSLRYQHVLHNFLNQQVSDEQRRVWHRRAADYYSRKKDYDSAVYHMLQARDHDGAAHLLSSYGRRLLAVGRLDTLDTFLGTLSPETLREHPELMCYLGDLARLHSRFQEGLGWYQQAEAIWREKGVVEGISRALRGQVRVYLDTIDPSGAEALLQRALRLIDGIDDRESRAHLYELLAENKLNAGHPEEAERLRQQAEALRVEGPSNAQLLYRVLLRTGRIEEARLKLEEQAEAERLEPVQVPRSHRETPFLLSFIYSIQGLPEIALKVAQEGTKRGEALDSPFGTAVGYMRQGHALMLMGGADNYARARELFKRSIEISRSLAIPRLGVEACWGLCRAYGFEGDLTQAQQAARNGIEVANQAGDEWIAGLARLAMGSSLTLAGRYESAEEWLSRSALGFQECSDPFGRSAARLWLCLGWFRQKQLAHLAQVFPEILSICRENNYDFLFTRSTLLGVPDERMLVPLLILARKKSWEAAYCERLLASMGLAETSLHPGYQLRVQALGNFNVWRGVQPIPANGWRREKARQLFQVLLTYHHAPLDRDQIVEHLWPELDPEASQRNFKVTLNTLFNVLEPQRERGSESAFIVREGSTYALRPNADIQVDAQTFTDKIQQADSIFKNRRSDAIRLYEEALELYQGDYLPDARYETWAAARREHLAVLFLNTADRLSEIHLERGQYEDSIQLCQQILALDNCWERAYRHLMLAYDSLGDRGQLARTYQRCVLALREELDVSPAPETEALYNKLIAKGA